MKKLLPLISVLFLISLGFGQKEYDYNKIVEQGGVYKKKFSDEIVNGKVFQMFDNTKIPLGKMKDGKKEGKWMVWNDNGTKKYEINYNNGLKNGLVIEWYDNGQKKSEETYKNNKRNGLSSGWFESGEKLRKINFSNDKKEGLSTQWYKSGQKQVEGTLKGGIGFFKMWYESGEKSSEGTFKNFIKDGLWTEWSKTGQKKSEENFKDGINHGLWTIWYDNGNKKSEWDYKDGELVNIIGSWNEDGSEKGKKQSVKTSETEKIIYEERPFRVSYILHKYDEDIEVELILNNMGNKPYSIVWFNFRFYNGDEMVGSERISFISLGVFGEQTEIIDFDEEFDKIEVEFLKSK